MLLTFQFFLECRAMPEFVSCPRSLRFRASVHSSHHFLSQLSWDFAQNPFLHRLVLILHSNDCLSCLLAHPAGFQIYRNWHLCFMHPCLLFGALLYSWSVICIRSGTRLHPSLILSVQARHRLILGICRTQSHEQARITPTKHVFHSEFFF